MEELHTLMSDLNVDEIPKQEIEALTFLAEQHDWHSTEGNVDMAHTYRQAMIDRIAPFADTL